MKNTFITLIIIMLSLQGCRTIKDRSSATNRVQQHSSQSSTFEWNYSDSAGRYWHYHSDSILFYHPDVGLYSQGGWLTVSERQVSQGGMWSVQDSIGTQSVVSTNKRTLSKGSNFPWWLWVGAGMLVGLLFLMVLGRKFILRWIW